MFLLEYGLFGAAGLVMGWIATTALAAHQIALQIASIMFMIPFGISMAATVRVGQAVGRRDADATRRAGFVAIALGAVFMVGDGGAQRSRRATSFRCISRNGYARQRRHAILAATLLVVGASFFIADGMQTVAAGALRGLNDTRIPLAFAALCFWVVGFPACYLLGFSLGGGAIGVWIGLSDRRPALCGAAGRALPSPDQARLSAGPPGRLALAARAPAFGHFLALGPRFRQPDRNRLLAAFHLAAAAAAFERSALALFHRAFDILGCAA